MERGERPGTQRKKQRKRLGHEERNRERQNGKDYIDWAKEIKKSQNTILQTTSLKFLSLSFH